MPERLVPTRHFLSWSGPALPAAAGWLLDRAGVDTAAGGDLSGLLVVVPGGRAQRRLVELLAEYAAARGLALVPPTVVTVGALADRLMPAAAVDGGPTVADADTSLLVRASVLRDAAAAGEGAVGELFPGTLPGPGDWPGWWSLSRQVQQLADELGTVGLTPGDAAGHAALTGDARWSACGALDARYHEALAGLGLIDPHAARRDAASEDASGPATGKMPVPPAAAVPPAPHVVLLATPDLRPIHTRLLAAHAAAVDVLVFADESDAAGFDAWGVLSSAYWKDRPLPVGDDAVEMVGGPGEQASAVLRWLSCWSAGAPLEPDTVTVGLGDGALGGAVERALELAGVPARAASGRPVSRSRPVLLLEALGAFAQDRRFDRLAALLRHPDALAFVARFAGEQGVELEQQHGGWVGLLDQYASDHLQGEVTGYWLGHEKTRAQLGAVHAAVVSLLPGGSLREQRPLVAWARPIGEALQQVYRAAALRRHAPDDRPVVQGLGALGDILDALHRLPADAGYQPATTFAQAAAYVLGRVDASPVPEPGGEPAVELVGVLELMLDDAAKAAVVGVNEGAVPQPIAEHPMLPRHVRTALGLHDDDHRLAREALMLSAVAGSRPAGDCVLIAGKTSAAGDPLMPSRLLLCGGDALMARRVARFFDEDAPSPPRPAAGGLLTPGDADRFLIPPPTLREAPLDALSVTAFRDYLACPYRFYLKHILKLRGLDDASVELDGGAFGSLAHDALRALGDEALATEDRPDKVYGLLSAVLDHRLREQYGERPPTAVRLQAEQLRYRLEGVAREQARLVAEGWRVLHVEGAGRGGRLAQAIDVDGESFTLTGKIDRIDEHPDLGYRVIDYKTSDRPKSPEQTHRAGPKGGKEWQDLQLPLYRDLCAALGVTGGDIELAYFNVPRKLSEVKVVDAGWDEAEIDDARAVRDRVIRELRAQRYWPPSLDPPVFDDGLAGVCADEADGRLEIVRRSGVCLPGREGGGDA